MSAPEIFSWIFETSLAVSALILLVLIVRRPVARHLGAGAAYALWLLPLIRLIMPAIPLPAPSTSAALPGPANPEIWMWTTSAPATVAAEPFPWEATLLVIWLAGAVGWLSFQLLRQIWFKSDLLENSRDISPKIAGMSARLADQIGLSETPQIKHSDKAFGPMVTGLFKPVIFLPENFETNYSAQQQELALAHELTHIRRGDLWAAAALLVFRGANWLNPLAHLAAGPFRTDQEAACDQSVLSRLGNGPETKSDYAKTLIHAAKLAGNPVRPHPLGLTIYNPLKERIMMMKTTPSSRLTFRVAASGLALAALLATAPYTRAEGPDTPTPPDAPETTVTASSVEKKVMKWVTKDDNGNETKRHIEIVTEDGVKKAYEIDSYGNKTEIDPGSIEMPDMGEHGPHKRVKVMKMGDGEMDVDIEQLLEKHGVEGGNHQVIIKRMGEHGEMDIDIEELIEKHGGVDGQNVFVIKRGEEMDVTSDGETKVIVKRMHGPGNTFAFSSDEDFEWHGSEGGSAKIMVNAASHMLDNVQTDDMDRDARKKVEKAQKALKEAMEALEEK